MQSLRVAALLAFLAVPTRAPAETCPASRLCVLGMCDSSTVAERARSEYSSYGYGQASHDLVVGKVVASGYAAAGYGSAGQGDVSARDRYVVIGLPAGTPITVHARAHVLGSAGLGEDCSYSSASFEAAISEPGGEGNGTGASASCEEPSVALEAVLPLDVPNLAGTPFLLQLEGHAFGSGGQGMVQIVLSFVDLPPGVAVVSCQGFISDPSVPARPTTWGELKTRYR